MYRLTRKRRRFSYGQCNLVQCLLADQQLACSSPPSFFRHDHLSQRLATTSSLYMRDLQAHYGCVNAIGFSNHGSDFLASAGDDQRVLVWRVAAAVNGTCIPVSMETKHHSNIFTVNFSCDNSYIYSAGNDGQIVQHDFASQGPLRVYQRVAPVYSVDTHPSCPHTIALATDDGSIMVVDTRTPTLSTNMVIDESPFAYHSVAFNPMDPQLLVSANESSGTSLFDIRQSQRLIKYNCTSYQLHRSESVSVCFNSTGTRVFSLYKSLPPCVFDTFSDKVQYHCVDDNGEYKNAVTMKSGCFAGANDEYVVSGSDDFRVYWWRVPDCEADVYKPQWQSVAEIFPHLVMPGHRSIVNQTRYSSDHHLLCSSGVEKVIKLWAPFHITPNDAPIKSNAPPSRQRYSQDEYLLMAQERDHGVLDDFSDQVTDEDPLMLALFDHLIDHENGEWEGQQLGDSSSESSNEELSGVVVQSPSVSSHDGIVLDESLFMDHDERMRYRLARYELMMGPDEFYDGYHTPSNFSSGNTSSLIPPWSNCSEEEEEEEEVEEEENTRMKNMDDEEGTVKPQASKRSKDGETLNTREPVRENGCGNRSGSTSASGCRSKTVATKRHRNQLSTEASECTAITPQNFYKRRQANGDSLNESHRQDIAFLENFFTQPATGVGEDRSGGGGGGGDSSHGNRGPKENGDSCSNGGSSKEHHKMSP